MSRTHNLLIKKKSQLEGFVQNLTQSDENILYAGSSNNHEKKPNGGESLR